MIYTVRGPIQKEKMGVTLSHEHFKWETDENIGQDLYFEKKYDEKRRAVYKESILPILNELAETPCQTIVETSPPIGGQDIKLLKELSEASGIHIIPCTGIVLPKYVYEIHPDHFAKRLSERWIKDFEEGLDEIDGVTIRPGYIKLLLKNGEKLEAVDSACLEAAVLAHQKTGMPIHCHVLKGEQMEAVMAHMDALKMDYSKFLWAHACHGASEVVIDQAVKRGMWIGFDNIRRGTYDHYIKLLNRAFEKGYNKQVILSMDYEFYDQKKESHALGYESLSLFNEFLPYAEENGLSSTVILDMMTEGPSRFYDVV